MFFYLHCPATILFIILSIIVDLVGGALNLGGWEGLIYLAIFIPTLAIAARRLHDINKSGWWQLIGIIPIIGWIVLIVWLASKGDSEGNRYGQGESVVSDDAGKSAGEQAAPAQEAEPAKEVEAPAAESAAPVETEAEVVTENTEEKKDV